MSGDALIPVTRVVELTSLSRSEIYRRVALKAFPEPIRISHKISRWSESECQAWVSAQLAKRGVKVAA